MSKSLSSSLSPSLSPSEGYGLYTKGDYATLPTNNNDLETNYTEAQEVLVSTRNQSGVGQTGTSQHIVHQFKNFLGSKTVCEIEWEGKTTLTPVTSTIYLQVYNQDTSLWETVDSNSTWQQDINFELSKKILDTTDYKDGSNVISVRVYQLAIGLEQTLTTDYFEILETLTYTDKYTDLSTSYNEMYPEGFLLLEDGNYFLLEDGVGKILLESGTIENALYTRKYPPLKERSHSRVVTPDVY